VRCQSGDFCKGCPHNLAFVQDDKPPLLCEGLHQYQPVAPWFVGMSVAADDRLRAYAVEDHNVQILPTELQPARPGPQPRC